MFLQIKNDGVQQYFIQDTLRSSMDLSVECHWVKFYEGLRGLQENIMNNILKTKE